MPCDNDDETLPVLSRENSVVAMIAILPPQSAALLCRHAACTNRHRRSRHLISKAAPIASNASSRLPARAQLTTAEATFCFCRLPHRAECNRIDSATLPATRAVHRAGVSSAASLQRCLFCLPKTPSTGTRRKPIAGANSWDRAERRHAEKKLDRCS